MATGILLDGDPSISEKYSQTTIIATGGVTLNGKKIVIDGDICNPYYLLSDPHHTNITPSVIASGRITINGIKIAVNQDALSPGDKMLATGLM